MHIASGGSSRDTGPNREKSEDGPIRVLLFLLPPEICLSILLDFFSIPIARLCLFHRQFSPVDFHQTGRRLRKPGISFSTAFSSFFSAGNRGIEKSTVVLYYLIHQLYGFSSSFLSAYIISNTITPSQCSRSNTLPYLFNTRYSLPIPNRPTMLPRAARRRNVFHQLRQSTEHLSLPWLCPATLRYHTQLNRPESSSISTAAHSEHRRRSSVFRSTRHLATATDAPPLSQTGGYVPFENFNYGTTGQDPRFEKAESSKFAQSLYEEPAIMIRESEMVTSPIFRRSKGIGGTLEDITARFGVSIRCGDLDMAAMSLDRMSKFPDIDPEFFLSLHNTYLEAVVDEMIKTRRSDETMSKALAMQTWFEVKLPRSTLQPDSRTMAIMLRMALRMLHGSRRDRTVRRYWNMVVENKFETDVMSMTDLLNDRDWGEISQVSSLISIYSVSRTLT